MLNKLLKTSLILVLAITLTACAGSKKKTPTDDGNTETPKTFCETYPESDLCKLIDGAVEMSPEDAKISALVQTGAGNGKQINISYQDTATWNSIIDIPVTNIDNTSDILLRVINTTNIDLVGVTYIPRIYAVDTGKNVGPTNNTGSLEKEGIVPASSVMYMNFPEAQTGKNLLVITFEKDGKKYFINFPNFTLSLPTV